jgi:hypothetical protein
VPVNQTLGIVMLKRFLRALLLRRAPPLRSSGEEALLNYALDLAQEWGKQWFKPIQPRLLEAYASLSEPELDRLNSIAQCAMKFGHDLVYSMAEQHGKKVDESTWREKYVARYPWVDEKNLRHLFSTGMYYAWKDGVV